MKIVLGFGVIALVVALFLSNKEASPPQRAIPASTPIVQEPVDFTATFRIVTNGLTRNFSASMYHNQSSDVYIEADDSSVVNVKREGVTWNDFFDSLPFKLTKDCLTTGTGETFCSGSSGTLRFYLNDNENQSLLDREIEPGDIVRITFSE